MGLTSQAGLPEEGPSDFPSLQEVSVNYHLQKGESGHGHSNSQGAGKGNDSLRKFSESLVGQRLGCAHHPTRLKYMSH